MAFRIEVDHRRKTNRETLAEALSIEKQIACGAIGKAAWEFTRREIVHPEIEGAENFAIARAHLQAGGSILAYLKDPNDKRGTPLGGVAIEKSLTSLDHAGVLVSRRQVDSNIGVPNLIQHLLLESFWGVSPGITMIPVVQEKDRVRYPDWADFNNKAVAKAEEFVTIPGNVLGVTPEGERNPDGLGEANIGFVALFRKARGIALALPIAIPEGTSKVIAGRPISWEEATADRILNPGMDMKTRLMARLALLFPPEQRGFYTKAASVFVMP